MSELTLTLMRLGLLIALWLFVLGVISVVRTDIYGVKVSRRAQRKAAARRQASQASAPLAGPSRPSAPSPQPQQQRPGPPPPPPNQGARSRLARAPRVPRSLVVTAGHLAGTTIPLTGSAVLIGRNPECTLILDDDYASGRHLRIHQTNDGWVAEDLDSTNGTFLNRSKLTRPTPLDASSVLQIGKTVIEVRS